MTEYEVTFICQISMIVTRECWSRLKKTQGRDDAPRGGAKYIEIESYK